MIVRARVTVKVDGVTLPPFPVTRRLDDTFLHFGPSVPIAAGAVATVIPNTTAKRVRAIRAHDPIVVMSGGQGLTHAIGLRREGLVLIFDENQLLTTDVKNNATTPAALDVAYAE